MDYRSDEHKIGCDYHLYVVAIRVDVAEANRCKRLEGPVEGPQIYFVIGLVLEAISLDPAVGRHPSELGLGVPKACHKMVE